MSTSSLFDRVVKQTGPLDFSGQLQIVRQSERILGGATGGRLTSNFPSWIEACLALINYLRRANAALSEN